MRSRNYVIKANNATKSMFIRRSHMRFEVVGLRIVCNGGDDNATVTVIA